jgi:hypothetical protein
MNYVELEKVLTEIIFKKDERTPLYIKQISSSSIK